MIGGKYMTKPGMLVWAMICNKIHLFLNYLRFWVGYIQIVPTVFNNIIIVSSAIRHSQDDAPAENDAQVIDAEQS